MDRKIDGRVVPQSGLMLAPRISPELERLASVYSAQLPHESITECPWIIPEASIIRALRDCGYRCDHESGDCYLTNIDIEHGYAIILPIGFEIERWGSMLITPETRRREHPEWNRWAKIQRDEPTRKADFSWGITAFQASNALAYALCGHTEPDLSMSYSDGVAPCGYDEL